MKIKDYRKIPSGLALMVTRDDTPEDATEAVRIIDFNACLERFESACRDMRLNRRAGESIKECLIRGAEEGDLVETTHYDGWTFGNPDDDMFPCAVDDDGDCIHVDSGMELRRESQNLAVRITIPVGASLNDVLRLIDKIRGQIDYDALPLLEQK